MAFSSKGQGCGRVWGSLPIGTKLFWNCCKVLVKWLCLAWEPLWPCISSETPTSVQDSVPSPTGCLEVAPIPECLYIYDSPKSILYHCAWAHWLTSPHAVKDPGSYCSPSWWVGPGPNVTDLLSVDYTWNLMPKLPEVASHLDPNWPSWDGETSF